MRLTLSVLGVALLLPVAARAQQDVKPPVTARESAQVTGGAGRAMQDNPMQARRARIQREIRRAFTRAVRNQVGLTDDQMRRLAPINQEYVRQRQEVARQERDTRIALRAELAKEKPDQDKVSQYLQQLQEFPRQRLDINDAEDKQLAGIMTPVQVARFRALEERVQRQLNMMRGRRGAGMGLSPDSGPEMMRGRGGRRGGGGG
jgi:hypothetical protein